MSSFHVVDGGEPEPRRSGTALLACSYLDEGRLFPADDAEEGPGGEVAVLPQDGDQSIDLVRCRLVKRMRPTLRLLVLGDGSMLAVPLIESLVSSLLTGSVSTRSLLSYLARCVRAVRCDAPLWRFRGHDILRPKPP